MFALWQLVAEIFNAEISWPFILFDNFVESCLLGDCFPLWSSFFYAKVFKDYNEGGKWEAIWIHF